MNLMDWYDSDDYNAIPEPFVGLITAIWQRSYSRIYKELRGRGRDSFRPQEAVHLLAEAMRCQLPLKAIALILEHCPPMPEIIAANNKDALNISGILHSRALSTFAHLGLVSWAAEHDRADVLSMLLEHGASPNRTCFTYSPLESALRGQSLECVQLLMEQPELDTAWTDELLQLWAVSFPAADACRCAMAPRFSGWDPLSGRQPPIPEPMKPKTIVQTRNWPLLERFCRERFPIPLEDGRKAIETFGMMACDLGYPDEEKYQDAFAGALTVLLESCPDLLRGEEECRYLLRSFLNLDEDARERLRPWAEGLGRRQVSMEAHDWTRAGHELFPDYWQTLLPNGPVLVIDRWSDIFDPSHCFFILDTPSKLLELSPEALRHILDACPIRGEGRKGELSPVAEIVLRFGGVSLVESLLQPGGLLASEDPDALIACVLQDECPRANRGAVLAFVRKEVDYDL